MLSLENLLALHAARMVAAIEALVMLARDLGHWPRKIANKAEPIARAVAFALLAGATPLWAGPSGEQVVAGQASVSRSGASTLINQTTDRAAINWQSFNIGATEAVRFAQPSASSIALNRVLGQNPTEIWLRSI